MKRVVVLVIVLSIAFAWSAQAGEGSKPYIPTRLEWLEVEFRSRYQTQMSEEAKYMLTFAALEKEDAIVIVVVHKKDVDRADMNFSIDIFRKEIQKFAQSHGWDGWLKIRESINMVD